MHYQDKSLNALKLGQQTKYAEKYDRTLLQPVPRHLNRDMLNITTTQPFTIGADIWTAYEISWLNPKGVPQVAIADVSIDFRSENLIESKSFKLYLNSFNQTQFANFDALDGDCIDGLDIEIEDYAFNAELLKDCTNNNVVEETLVSHLLKSNCLITQQPDWGSLQIHYVGKQINREQLLRYIISFRQHNEFHEQCVERIFCDLMHFAAPEKLTVYARYTRRGGLDINPYRSNFEPLPPNLRLARQ